MMFCLDNTIHYWLHSRPVNMHMRFNRLCLTINNSLGLDIRNGDMFAFFNASRNHMKILHREGNSLVLYSFAYRDGQDAPSVPQQARRDYHGIAHAKLATADPLSRARMSNA